MLRERGVPLDEIAEPPGEGEEIVAAYRAAPEVSRLVKEDDPDVSLADVAAAWENYQLVQDSPIAVRPAP
jgi:hypothetical protein